MNKWLLSVPKLLHIYWGGRKLPYLRFLTVKSFMKFNPDWKIILWYPEFESEVITWDSHEHNYKCTWEDWRSKLFDLNIEKKAVDFKDFGLRNNISEVHKSDFLRCYVLGEYGGVWSDMDILYFRPIIDMKPLNNKETFVCISHYGHSVGFLMAQKENKFFKKMCELIVKCDFSSYQIASVNVFNENFKTIESIEKISSAENIGMEVVYFYNGQNVMRLYEEKEPIFHINSIGCHWYAGSPLSGKFLNETNGGLDNLPNNIMGNLCLQARKYF